MRSTIASSSMPIFSTSPKVTAGSVIVPRASIGRVVPLIVSSPSTISSLFSVRTSVELKVMAGKRSVSKKSGAERCAARFSSLTAIESAATEPVRRSVPSSAAVSVAS